MTALTPDEIDRYRREGYVVPGFALPAPEVAALQQALDELIRRNPGVRPEKLVSAHIERARADHGEGERQGANEGDQQEANEGVQQEANEGVRGVAAFLDLARDARIVELVSGVLGDDIVLWGCHVFCKPAREGYETPWHQDGHYWPIRPLATCTVWVAIEDSLADNGCLRVVPGSHAARALHAHLHEDRSDLTLNQRLAAGAFDEADAVDVQLRAGQMSLHDVYMIHGARPNTSARRRTGVALRYMPATSLFDRALRPVDGASGVPVNFAQRPLWLVRGVDRHGGNDFKLGHA